MKLIRKRAKKEWKGKRREGEKRILFSLLWCAFCLSVSLIANKMEHIVHVIQAESSHFGMCICELMLPRVLKREKARCLRWDLEVPFMPLLSPLSSSEYFYQVAFLPAS